ncbi:MAG: hypothetical protein EXR27_16870 [Betaproteobacteria bacterium]|nr:hypothetical protein [Betaproteobacteria bacterium]
MAEKRLVYLTSRQLTAYRWKSGSIEQEGVFESGEEGVKQFAQYVAGSSESLFYVLADVVEEDFHQENIPYLHGADRRTLLARKIAQRYRDTSLVLAMSLGTEAGERREERILFSSFTNTQQFQPWLAVLEPIGARLVGLYSVALISPLLGKRIRFPSLKYLLVSLQKGGLRQTFVENGHVRFSRLGRADNSDPRALAETCASESNRIQQFLVNLRILPRESGPLDVLMIAPSKYKPLYDAACVGNSRVRFHVHDFDDAARTAGLKNPPTESGAEALFMHVLAQSQPAQQFASDDLRKYYHLWRARVALMTAGAAIFGFCLVFSAIKIAGIYSVNDQVESDRRQEATAAQQYAKVQATFPKTPTSTDNLRAIVKNYAALQSQTVSLDRALVDISRALAGSPQLELEKIDWEANTGARQAGRDAGKAPPATPPPPAPVAGKPGAAPPPEPRYQAIQISGRVSIGQRTDYRGITQVVDKFAAALAASGAEIVSKRLPFDINAEKSLAGDVGEERSTEVPRFVITMVKRVGA